MFEEFGDDLLTKTDILVDGSVLDAFPMASGAAKKNGEKVRHTDTLHLCSSVVHPQ